MMIRTIYHSLAALNNTFTELGPGDFVVLRPGIVPTAKSYNVDLPLWLRDNDIPFATERKDGPGIKHIIDKTWILSLSPVALYDYLTLISLSVTDKQLEYLAKSLDRYLQASRI